MDVQLQTRCSSGLIWHMWNEPKHGPIFSALIIT